MNINATLLGQMITFLLFVLFTKRFVWPFVTKALQERQEKIADGLAAAEKGHKDLELAREKAVERLKESKVEAQQILDDAKKQAATLIDNAKEDAKLEELKIKAKTEADIEQMVAQAKESLRKQAARMAIVGAERVLGKNIDEASNQALLDDLVEGL